MEDFQLDILIGKGPTARSIRLDLPRFTLVGATTRTGLLTEPAARPVRLRGPARPLRRRRPRRASWCARPGSSACEVDADGRPPDRRAVPGHAADRQPAPAPGARLRRGAGRGGDHRRRSPSQGLELFGVDELGLDKVDRAILDALCRRFDGRPVGLVTLAQCVGEEPDTIEDAYEPYLLQQGLLQRTPRGRVATPRAFAHLGEVAPVDRAPGTRPPRCGEAGAGRPGRSGSPWSNIGRSLRRSPPFHSPFPASTPS